MNTWISVKEKLPPMFKDVLCISKRKRYAITCVDASGKLDKYSLMYSNDYYTHWRYLPKPPIVLKKQTKLK